MGNKWPSKKLRKLVRKELCNWVKPLLLKKNGKLVDNLVWLSKTRSSFLEKAFYECGALNSSLWNNKINSWKMISSIKNRATDLNNYHIPNKGPTRLYNDQFKKAKQKEHRMKFQVRHKTLMGFSLAQLSPTVLCLFPVASATFGCSKELLKALSSSSVLQEHPRASRCPVETILQNTANSTHKATAKQERPPRAFWVLYSSKTR